MGVQTPEYMALVDQLIETLDQWSQSASIEGGLEKSHPEAMFNRKANQKLWPCITRLGQGEEDSALLFFDWGTTW